MNETESDFIDKALRDLPQEIQPTRDLWPGIEIRLRQHKWLSRLSAYAAAAVVLVTVGSVGVILGMHAGNNESMVVLPPTMSAVQSNAAYFARRRAFLIEAVSGIRSLDPHSRSVLPRELVVVESSIEQLEAALQNDPGNMALVQLLNQSYRTEAELLNVAVRAPNQTTSRRAL